MSLDQTAGPVGEDHRLTSLDALRGLAVLGILAMNIQYFSQVSAAYLNPTVSGPLTGSDLWIWLTNHLLFEDKMMSIFSMLYGAGIVLLGSRLETRGVRPLAIFLRRSLWLMLFGALHAYLLWSGDVLFSYAVCGLAVYPCRRWPPKRLLLVGVIAISVSSLVYVGYRQMMRSWSRDQVLAAEHEIWRPTQRQIAAEIAAYRGGWRRQMVARVPNAELLEGQGLLYLTLWRSGGLMLAGMALYKLGWLTGGLPARQYARSGLAAFALGTALVGYGVYRDFAEHWSMRYAFFIGSQFNYWGSLAVAWSWISLVLLACKTAALQPVVRRFALVGRMAFSNYILETILCTTIFYGHGLGMFARLDRARGMLVVFAVWIVLFVFSQLWMRSFHFGPLEWLWRSLTYGRIQRFRRVA